MLLFCRLNQSQNNFYCRSDAPGCKSIISEPDKFSGLIVSGIDVIIIALVAEFIVVCMEYFTVQHRRTKQLPSEVCYG